MRYQAGQRTKIVLYFVVSFLFKCSPGMIESKGIMKVINSIHGLIKLVFVYYCDVIYPLTQILGRKKATRRASSAFSVENATSSTSL